MILCFRFSLHFRAANRFRNLLSSNGMVLLLDDEVSWMEKKMQKYLY